MMSTAVAAPVQSRAEQLPFHELTWRRFQVFCQDLISRLPDVSDSHQYGVEGNPQDGIDLFADMTNDERWAFQNKRWKQFGPQDVEDAVGATTYKADKYVILLSREATAAARKKVASYPGWDVWDRCDLSNKVRQLPVEAARRLVDDHFGPWWRRAFLGLDAVAAFLAPNDFFRELLDTDRLFHHSFDLIGRADQLAALAELIRSGRLRAAVLPGRGGIGKTRLLRAFAQRAEADGPEPAVRFLVEGVPLTPQSLDELPGRPCVVVVDDAHRSDGLQLLLAHARHRKDLKLLLATRPHAADYLRVELTRAGFDATEVASLSPLGPLSRDEVRELARAALGPAWRERNDIVDRLTRVTRDCPLATVIGGRLLAEKAIPPELLAQDHTFRHAVFDRFQDELLGHIGPEYSADLARRVLHVLAAVNPISDGYNQTAWRRVAEYVGADPVEVVRLAGELERIGLLARRGGQLRLIPDVFADHLLATACLTPQNRPTGFAERVFESFRDVCPELVLRNLAELDWRVRSAGGQTSRLLDRMWASIKGAFRAGTSGTRARIIDSVMEAARYQPRHALELARVAIRPTASAGISTVGRDEDADAVVLERLPELLRRCAYTPDTLPECLDLLWELGLIRGHTSEPRDDQPFRVIQDIAKYDHGGHWWVGREVARRAGAWLRAPAGSCHRRRLLDILDPLLVKSGEDAWSEGHRLCIVSFLIPYAAVRDTRRAAFAILRQCLDTGDLSLQLRALASLERALNGPMPAGGVPVTAEWFASWEPDQLEILGLLAEFLARRHQPVVQLRVFEAVRFQAVHSHRPAVRQRAQAVTRLVEDSFEVRLTRLLIPRLSRWDDVDDDEPGAGGTSRHSRLLERQRRRHEAVLPELWQRHSTSEAAFAYLNGVVRSLREVEPEADAGQVLWYLLSARPDQAAPFAELCLAEPASPLGNHLATCLVHVRRTDPNRATALARAAVDSGHVVSARGAGHHYCWDWPDGTPLSTADVEIIRQLLAHPDLSTRQYGLGALRHLTRTDTGLAVELVKSVDFGDSTELVEELARPTDSERERLLDAFCDDDLRVLLRKLVPIRRLEYSVCELLRRVTLRMPDEVLDLFLRRIDHQDTLGYSTGYEILPYSGVYRIFEACGESGRQADLVRRVRDRALTTGRWKWSALPQLYWAVSGNFGPEGLAALREWLDSGDPERVVTAVELLGEAGPDFVFDRHEFVDQALSRAEALGDECLAGVRSALLGLALSAAREGPAGQPYPQDVDLRDRAAAMLEHVPRGEPLHRLFEEIRRNAESRIRAEVASDDEFGS